MRVKAGAARVPAAEAPARSEGGAALDYEALFECAPIGHVLLDASGRIEKINRTAAAMLGWDPAWLVGKPFPRWIHQGDKASFHAWQCQLSDRAGPQSLGLRIKTRQGRTLSLRLDGAARRGSCGEDREVATDFHVVMIDVSGERQDSRKLRRQQAQLTQLARLSTAGELASNLAHELNQPLGTVVLNCDAALRLLSTGSGGEAECAEALVQAREAAAFAAGVVRHLRGFLRTNADTHTVCPFATLLRDTTTLIEADARDDDIELELDIASDLPPVRADAVQIEQVLVNLAHNSIEAIRASGNASGTVTIRARREPPGRIRVSVADTGPGLEAKQLNRIFAPFYSTKKDGMGMGLSISRTIVEAHGGKLWAERGTRTGAAVHFTLPSTGEPPA